VFFKYGVSTTYKYSFVSVPGRVVFPESVNKRPGIKADVLAVSRDISLFPYLNI